MLETLTGGPPFGCPSGPRLLSLNPLLGLPLKWQRSARSHLGLFHRETTLVSASPRPDLSPGFQTQMSNFLLQSPAHVSKPRSSPPLTPSEFTSSQACAARSQRRTPLLFPVTSLHILASPCLLSALESSNFTFLAFTWIKGADYDPVSWPPYQQPTPLRWFPRPSTGPPGLEAPLSRPSPTPD